MKTYQSIANRARIVLNSRTRLNVPVNFVIMLKGKVNYTTFVMSDGSEKVVAYTLKYFESFLETHGFQRIHRCGIINPKFIKKYSEDIGLVTMKNGMSMKVSRRRKEALLENAAGFSFQ
jgi:DNA-binding LytR/AlgR family response regulator